MTEENDPRPAREGSEAWDRRRVGALVASVPVLLFALAVVFVMVRRPAAHRCRHGYDTRRVREWWSRAQRESVSVPGTRYLAFDDSSGCIYVGLEEPRAQPHLDRRLRRLGIPREVVVYERVEGEARP